MPPGPAAGPLAGTVILDASSLAPGAYATLVLARLGAEVIKLERPEGDPVRAMRAPGTDPFRALNSGKKSVVVDLKTAAGQEKLDELISRVDVIVENYLPDTALRLGLTFERIRARDNRVILCSLSGYSEASERFGAPGHDLNFWAESGALGFVTSSDVPPRLPVSDMLGGLAASTAITSALVGRTLSGTGEHVRVSLADAMLHAWVAMGLSPEDGRSDPNSADALGSATATDSADAGGTEIPGGPWQTTAGYAVYTTADGCQLAVAVEEIGYWRAFCTALGHPEFVGWDHLRGDDIGSTQRARIQGIIGASTLSHWLEVFDHGRTLPVNAVVTPDAAVRAARRDARAGGGAAVIAEAEGAWIPQLPFSMAGFSPPPATHAPALGQHSSELLSSRGVSRSRHDSA